MRPIFKRKTDIENDYSPVYNLGLFSDDIDINRKQSSKRICFFSEMYLPEYFISTAIFLPYQSVHRFHNACKPERLENVWRIDSLGVLLFCCSKWRHSSCFLGGVEFLTAFIIVLYFSTVVARMICFVANVNRFLMWYTNKPKITVSCERKLRNH